MGQFEKILIRILCGTKDKDIDFNDLCKVLVHFEFKERINGSHHIFYKDGIDEIINIQPNGCKSKVISSQTGKTDDFKYKLGGGIDA